ncbi:MAG: DUF1924 domain-containing protein [Candidatus Polarisedimenticolaceae bacterium]|nr:DUF1924 domain-containing protein [Candidatus Polarisedimenticolaceae bacterium]
MNCKHFTIAALLIVAPLSTQADAISDLQATYQNAGASQFSATAGKTLWHKGFTDVKSGQQRQCTTCHTENLQNRGEHIRTGKVIEPMAPSANPERLTQVKKIKKWLHRNCKWTLGRECSAQEKGDLLAFLKNL